MPTAAIIPELKQSDIERFWSKVNIPENKNDCWLWEGYKIKDYGAMTIAPSPGKELRIPAPRLSYYLANKTIDRYKVVMHSCDNPSCVNPTHLVLGTSKSNSQDMSKKGRSRKTFQPGENHPNTKLTYNNIEEIRLLLSNGESQTDIANKFNVDQSLISRISSNVYWKKELMHPITNCGLIALRNISELKNITVRTLVNLAEDNGLELHPYKLPLNELQSVPLPAIFHATNHFEFITHKDQLTQFDLTGIFILSESTEKYPTLSIEEIKKTSGASWVSVGIAGVGLGVQLGSSIVKNQKAKKIAKANIRPEYLPNEQVLQNADLAASRAGSGLGDASKTLFSQQNQRNLSQSLDAILRAGGGANQVSELYANSADAMLKLASLDSDLQNRSVNTFMNANSAKGAEFQSAWEVNEFAPYNDRAQLAALLRTQSQQELNGAIQTGMQGASNYLTASMYKNKPAATPPDANYDNISGALENATSSANSSQRYLELLLQGDKTALESYNNGWS